MSDTKPNLGWEEALEIVIARTKHEPYRRACADENPNHDVWRQRMIEKATGIMPTPGQYPSLFVQTKNLNRAFWDWAVSGFTMASEEEQARRLAICETCPNYAADQKRCRLCGCWLQKKVKSKVGKCPDKPPRW